MIRHLIVTGMMFLASTGANGTPAGREEDEDNYDVWEPVYSFPDTSASGSAVITDIIPSATPDFMIFGPPAVDARTIWHFIRRHNTEFPIEIAEAFLSIGARYGIRGDVAICQAIIETGWFRFADGTAVTPDQHNYCGLGVTERGKKGHMFDSIHDGVRAHLQHLYAYASTAPLPEGEPLLDPRFSLVPRGVARTWHDLSNRWAMNPNYGRQIFDLYSQLIAHTENDKQSDDNEKRQ